MTRTPGTNANLADLDVRPEGKQWTLVFTRDLRHPPEAVWIALTDPAELRQWAPFDADRNLGTVGEATLTMADAGGQLTDDKLSAVIGRANRAHVLEYTWGDDVLRWELEPVGSGQRTRLTLRHTMEDRDVAPKVAAGWHVCLDVAERMLDGDATGRVVGEDAKRHGWEALRDAYEEKLGRV